MNHFREIANGWRDQGLKLALATVIKVKGSAYRREGAKMLIAEDGRSEGSVSGGCLESDLIENAKKVVAENRPSRHFYDMTADDDLLWGLGLGCNGAVDVLLEPLPDDIESVLGDVAVPSARCVLVQLDGELPSTVRSMMIQQDGRGEGSLGDPELERQVREKALELLDKERSTTLSFQWSSAGSEHTAEVYIESRIPDTRFVIFGAGHDAIPLVPLAKKMGWRVQVVDSRPQFAVPQRFPEADQVLHAHAEDFDGKVPTGPFVYAMVMTHRFQEDMKILKWLAGKEMGYVGVLGPRDRLEKMLEAARQEGTEISLDQMPFVYNPAGLDIGGDTPEQVALSIVAEIMAVKNKRRAGFLRDRRGPIHERTHEAAHS